MTDTPSDMVPAHSTFRVLAALADLGDTTAGHLADHLGLGYSTVTPKLRAWETSGHAERYHSDKNQTLWRLTPTGRATTATGAEHRSPATAPPAEEPGDEQALDMDTIDPGDTQPEPGTDAALDDTQPDRDLPPTSDPTDNAAPDRDEEPVSEPEAETGTGVQEQAKHHDNGALDEHPDMHSTSPLPAADPAGEAPAGTGDTVAPIAVDAATGGTDLERRAPGSLRAAILTILEAHPGQGYKVSELCRLINRAAEGTTAKKAGGGAVANAAHKLVEKGEAVLLVEKPATFAVPATDA